MKILIIGSEGFIGSHLVRYFASVKHDVYGCDLFETGSQTYQYSKVSRLAPEFDELFENNKFDACINAGGSGNVPYSMTHPFSDFEANTLDTIRVLESIRRHYLPCRYLHISSAAVYGNPARLPVQESDPLHPLSPYGWHKLIAEKLCTEYSTIYQVPTASVRPFSVYGPGLRKQLLWDLYQKSLQHSETITLWGSGHESRDFIFIDDLVRLFELILEKGNMTGEAYNAGTGVETTVAGIASLFYESMGINTQVIFNGKVREGDPINWKAGIAKIEQMGFTPAVNITSGIIKLAQWMKSLH